MVPMLNVCNVQNKFLSVSLTDDTHTACLCIFIKLLLTGKFIETINIQPVLSSHLILSLPRDLLLQSFYCKALISDLPHTCYMTHSSRPYLFYDFCDYVRISYEPVLFYIHNYVKTA